MSTYDLPEDTDIESVGKATLPFLAPVVFWRIGNKDLEFVNEVKGVQRFGGWAIQVTDIDPFKEVLQPLPSDFARTKLSGKDGEYENFLSRSVKVAIIRRRFAWFEGEGSTTQYLAYLDGFGAIVLQAKSLSGIDLDKAIEEFKKLSSSARWDEVKQKSVSEQFFFFELGTFGENPFFKEKKSKRKVGESSYVAYPSVNIPQGGFNSNTIKYVGKDVAGEIVKLHRTSKEWADDWNNRKGDKPKVENSLPPMPDDSPFGDPSI